MRLTEKKIETLFHTFYFIKEYLEEYWRKLGADVMNIMIDELMLLDTGLQVHYKLSKKNKKNKIEHKYWISGIPYKEGTKTLMTVEEYLRTTNATEYSLKLEGDIEDLSDRIEKAKRDAKSHRLKAVQSMGTISTLEKLLLKKQKALDGLQIN